VAVGGSAGKAAGKTLVEVDGHRMALTNLDKVLYPETGTTKAEVINYYAQVAPAMLPHVVGRPITRKRWPNGVQTEPFFQKNVDRATPDWIPVQQIDHRSGAIGYPLAESAAALAWFGQNGALELHVPQWQFTDAGLPGEPDRMVFDLDPGPGVTLDRCAQVAFWVREILDGVGLTAVPVTSGSKGLHLYVRVDGSRSSGEISQIAQQIAQVIESEHPDLVTSRMSKVLRPGKVFIDWSQNNGNKTTIAPYSLRGRPTRRWPRSAPGTSSPTPTCGTWSSMRSWSGWIVTVTSWPPSAGPSPEPVPDSPTPPRPPRTPPRPPQSLMIMGASTDIRRTTSQTGHHPGLNAMINSEKGSARTGWVSTAPSGQRSAPRSRSRRPVRSPMATTTRS